MKAIIRAGALVCLLACANPAQAQMSWFTGYVQIMPIVSRATALSQGGASEFNRLRLAGETSVGQFSFEAAYEHALTFRENEARGGVVGSVPGGGEWLDLQGTLEETEHALWRHRFDRLNVGWQPTDAVRVSVGRQAVSWATTLFLTPADPFTPFDPGDPFREFRAGVDSLRVRVYPNALSEVDVVVRPTKNALVGEELTVLGRGLTVWNGWEVSAWAGALYGDASVAIGTAGSLGSLAVRGEAVVRRVDERTVFRGSVGVDRYFTIAGKDGYVVLEYQHDGLAARGADRYSELFLSDAFRRGELQVFGRDEMAVNASYQVHPLCGAAATLLWNMSDGSALLSPTVSYSLSNEATITAGAFFGFGDDEPRPGRPLSSEYGLVGTTAFTSASVFF